MKRLSKRFMAFFLAIVLVITSFGIYGITISAATTDTRYSNKHLENGGFEDNEGSYKWSGGYTQPKKTDVPYWDTTAYGTGSNGMFEFFKGRSAGNTNHFKYTQTNYPNQTNLYEVAQGNIAAELNADEVSTIYQRIKTVSGSTYTWGLDHRGREATDRMVLIIGPEQSVDPSKPSKAGDDQFVRITNWLKVQYNITYPETGCSKKYTVYSKPFAASGKFENESTNEDENISMAKTDEINQEWNIWVISSLYCNTSTIEGEAVNGWSKYGTNRYDKNDDSYNDVIKGESSPLGYDCTYTVPKGQTNTIFAFCSYSSYSVTAPSKSATFGNLLDDINFELYQPISSSITPGGTGGVANKNAIITTDIQNGSSFFETVNDGELCYIHTQKNEGDTYKFQGAYVTVYSNDGKPTTTFVSIYPGSEDDFIGMDPQDRLAKAQKYFIPDGTGYKDAEGNQKYWDYVYAISVESPVHIHMMYTKAPYILYDSNGGETYRWKNDNSAGGNLVGFRDGFKGSEVGEPSEYSDYYKDVVVESDKNDDGIISEKITAGFYKSHAALPNENWNKITLEDGSVVGSRFLGWAITGIDNKQVILDGNHTATYSPDTAGVGNIVFTDASNHNVEGLVLDATRGVTLTAQWKFGYTAQAQTLTGHSLEEEEQEYINSAVGGTVSETFIDNRSDVEDHKDAEGRVERTDAYGSVGSKIIFRATPDTANNYVFDGWYTKETDGTYKLVTTDPKLAITVEEGKSEAYYARFKTKKVPVIFYYSASGNPADYDYYDKNTNNKYGKHFQEVVYNEKAVPPKDDSKKVTMWFTSPTERDQEHLFNFSTPITEKTKLYASPMFNFNYYTGFSFTEPWIVEVYATLLLRNDNNTTKFVDMKSDPLISDFNTYMLTTSEYGDTTPKASEIKDNSKTVRVGKNKYNSQVLYNSTTNTQVSFNRCGARLPNAYIFNMHIPTWVVFDFTYNGITYTSAIADRCLYNEIDIYMKTESNGYFTTFPKETQAVLRTAQTKMLESIRAMNEAIVPKGITEPTEYKEGVTVTGLTVTEDTAPSADYTFESTTAIRNIEPWGFKYSFGINGADVTNFNDYGAIVFSDTDDIYKDTTPTIYEILNNSNSLLYSKSMNNYYTENGSICVHHVNGIKATDFEKNTYAVFFIKDSNGNYHYSKVIANSYNSIANNDTNEETKEISKSIKTYSEKLIAYYKAKKDAASSK